MQRITTFQSSVTSSFQLFDYVGDCLIRGMSAIHFRPAVCVGPKASTAISKAWCASTDDQGREDRQSDEAMSTPLIESWQSRNTANGMGVAKLPNTDSHQGGCSTNYRLTRGARIP